MSSMSELPLSDADRAMLSIRADQFHDALTRGLVADWSPFLDGLTGTLRRAVLTELAVIDLGHRWERGDQVSVEEYVARYPELGPLDSVPAVLVQEEERCRAKATGNLNATAYSARSPARPPAGGGDGVDEVGVTRTVRASGRPIEHTGWGGEGVVALDQQYDLVRELGRGAFGEVWLARKQPSGIEKAVKILHQPADQDSAQRELRALELIKNLRHPYLLATEDFWVANNRLFIVTELADYTLRGRLKECKEAALPGIPEDELLGYMHEAAEGFDYLHTKMITHRDVKPDNILVVNGHAKVADFGLARQSESQVAVMSFAGTPAYMAPEVWGGEGGPPSDLYGFAVSYVELRQGSQPFKSGKVMEMMQAHLSGDFSFADFISESERAVLRKAMAQNPADRHPTCQAFVEELAEAMGRTMRRSGRIGQPAPRVVPAGEGEAPSTETSRPAATVHAELPPKPYPPLQHPPPRPSRRRRALAGGALGVAVLVALGVWAGHGRNSPGGKSGGGTGNDSEIVVPRGTTPEPDKIVPLADGRRVPEWVAAERGGEKMRFRLIAPTGGPQSTLPFYISETKVWNRLYDDAGRAAGLDIGQREEPGGPDAPAVNMTANAAAAWAGTIFEGGRLPTPAEWDHAAGYYDRQGHDRPLRAGGRARITKAEPAPVRGAEAALAVNQYGLIDMAGNGREWTAALLPARGRPPREVIGPTFEAGDLVVLRGRNYTLRTPLTYEVMRYEESEPQTQFAAKASPYTGFRVVLPMPAP